MKLYQKYIIGIGILGLCLMGFPNLRLDNSFDVWFPESDPELQQYKKFLEEYGNDEVIVVDIPSETSSPSLEELESLRELQILLEKDPAIRDVESLASLASMKRQFDEADSSLVDRSAALEPWEFLLNSTKIGSRMYTEGYFRVWVSLKMSDNLEDLRGPIHRRVEDAIANAFPSRNIEYAGVGIILDALNVATISESAWLQPLSLLLLLGLLFVATRKIKVVLVGAAVLALSNVCLFGLMGIMGRSVNMITMAIPPLLMVTTASNLLHLSRHRGKMKDVMKPVFFNAATTAAGFLSLQMADMAVTKDYGLFAGAGVILVWVFTYLFSSATHQKSESKGNLPMPTLKSGVIPWVLAAVLIVVGSLFVPKINVDTYSLGFLPKEHPVRMDDESMSGRQNYLPLYFLLPDSQKAWENADALEKLDEKIGLVLAKTSADFHYSLGAVYADFKALSGQIPKQLDKLAYPERGLRWRNSDSSQLLLQFSVPMSSAAELKETGEEIRAVLKRDVGVDVIPAGYLPLYDKLVTTLLTDQIQSLSVAFILVFIILGLVVRSFRLFAAGLSVNVLPLFGLGIVMYLLDIPLDISTITVAPAMLGIMVDDTIHYLFEYKRLRKNNCAGESIRILEKRLLPTLAWTTLCLFSAFAIMGFSRLGSLSNTGILIACTTLFALLCDGYILPVVIKLLDSEKGYEPIPSQEN